METITQHIPRHWWPAYFNDLSKLYRGWRLTVEVLRKDLGEQRVTKELRLNGLSFEKAGSEAGDILIEVGELPLEFMIHHIDQPRNVWVSNASFDSEMDIGIESEDGTVTLIYLRPRPALPGFVPSEFAQMGSHTRRTSRIPENGR